MKRLGKHELNLIGIVFALVAALMVFFPAVSSGDSNTSYTGLQVAFGHEFVNLGGFASGQIEYSILNGLAYLLPLAAALLWLLNVKNQIIPTILLLIAIVLLFLIPESTNTTVTILGNTNAVDIDWVYGMGVLNAILFSIMGMFYGILRIYHKV